VRGPLESTNSSYISCHNRESSSQPTLRSQNNDGITNVNDNFDEVSLNNIFYSISKNMEAIYNMICSAYLPHNESPILQLPSHNNNQE